MGNKEGAETRERLYGSGYHKRIASNGGKVTWGKIELANPLLLKKNRRK